MASSGSSGGGGDGGYDCQPRPHRPLLAPRARPLTDGAPPAKRIPAPTPAAIGFGRTGIGNRDSTMRHHTVGSGALASAAQLRERVDAASAPADEWRRQCR